MPRRTTGSIYRCVHGYGIRWGYKGKRMQKAGFPTEDAAREWFARHRSALLQGDFPDFPADEIRRWAQLYRDEGESWVYVIASHEAQRIKIGRTSVPAKRMRDLRCASPVQLTPLLYIPGGEALEDALLRLTEPYAATGGSEWRTLDALEVIIAFIRERAASGIRRPVGSRRRAVAEPFGDEPSPLVELSESA